MELFGRCVHVLGLKMIQIDTSIYLISSGTFCCNNSAGCDLRVRGRRCYRARSVFSCRGATDGLRFAVLSCHGPEPWPGRIPMALAMTSPLLSFPSLSILSRSTRTRSNRIESNQIVSQLQLTYRPGASDGRRADDAMGCGSVRIGRRTHVFSCDSTCVGHSGQVHQTGVSLPVLAD
jgi:hypothetical protein